MSIIIIVLLIPLAGMLFSDSVNWDWFDFVVAGILLLGAGLTCEIVFRKVKTRKLRIILCLGFILMLVLIIAELGVGLFGTPFAGN